MMRTGVVLGLTWAVVVIFVARNSGVESFGVSSGTIAIGRAAPTRHDGRTTTSTTTATTTARRALMSLKVAMDWTSGEYASSSSSFSAEAAAASKAVSEQPALSNKEKEAGEHEVGAAASAAENEDGSAAPSVSGPVEDYSAPLTFRKFLTMQDKRVVVTVRYSDMSGFRPFFLTVAKKVKDANPDVVLERQLLPLMETSSESKKSNDDLIFEILVDGKVVNGKNRTKKQLVGGSSEDATGGRSVFVSMEDVAVAIAKARRRRRPSTLYEDSTDGGKGAGLEILRSATNWTKRQGSTDSTTHHRTRPTEQTPSDAAWRRKYGSKWT